MAFFGQGSVGLAIGSGRRFGLKIRGHRKNIDEMGNLNFRNKVGFGSTAGFFKGGHGIALSHDEWEITGVGGLGSTLHPDSFLGKLMKLPGDVTGYNKAGTNIHVEGIGRLVLPYKSSKIDAKLQPLIYLMY